MKVNLISSWESASQDERYVIETECLELLGFVAAEEEDPKPLCEMYALDIELSAVFTQQKAGAK
jgi:hypothetical protein